MFTEVDMRSMVAKFVGMTKLFTDARMVEFAQMDSYGTVNKVPLIFWESISPTRGNVLMSKTPRGKVVFPGPAMIGIATIGVLYFLNLQHIRGKNGKIYCHTVGSDWHTDEYWKEIIAGRKISAIKMCRQFTGLGLKEAKDIVDKECDYVDFSINNPQWASSPSTPSGWSPTYSSSGVASAIASDQQKKIITLQDEVQRWQKEVDHIRSQMRIVDQESMKKARKIDELEYELAETITKFASYVKANPQNKPVTKTKYNVWDLIGAKANDPKPEIEAKIKQALKLYHPNLVFQCGKVLQDIANEITLVILDLKKSLK